MPKTRRSAEAGHKRKFLVVIDDTPECVRALQFAARRAEHTGGGLTILYVIVQNDPQQWLGVENIMRAEAAEQAETTLSRFAEMARNWSKVEPELVIREGNRAEEVVKLIGEDQDIAILVLAASADKDGPGPLVSSIAAKNSGSFPVPITIVPGFLDEDAILAVT